MRGSDHVNKIFNLGALGKVDLHYALKIKFFLSDIALNETVEPKIIRRISLPVEDILRITLGCHALVKGQAPKMTESRLYVTDRKVVLRSEVLFAFEWCRVENFSLALDSLLAYGEAWKVRVL